MSKVNLFIFAILIIVIAGMAFNLKAKDAEIGRLVTENFTLSERLKAQIQITNGKYKIVYRDKEVVKYVNVFVPPENTTTYIYVDNDDQVNIEYKKFDFTFTPFVGVSYSGELSPEIGARLFYFDRWGTGISLSPKNVRAFVDYRPDLSFMKNSSVGVFISNDQEVGANIHTFF